MFVSAVADKVGQSASTGDSPQRPVGNMCPDCNGTTLSFKDSYDESYDRVDRAYTCRTTDCGFTFEASRIPISEWPEDAQQRWYHKTSRKRAREELIRCPSCGKESIDAEEAGVKGIGTSSHVWLSCKTSDCSFAKRKVRRSIGETAKVALQYCALVAVVVGAIWLGKLALAGGSSDHQVPSPAPTPSPSASTTSQVAPEEVPLPVVVRESPTTLSVTTLQERLGRMLIPFRDDGAKQKPEFVNEKDAKFLGVSLSTEPFSVESGGMSDGQGRFALVARTGHFVVDRLYLKVHSIARCDLRSETTEYQSPTSTPAYAFGLTDQFQYYDLVSQNEPGQSGGWRYDGADSDEIGLRLSADPYTLFLVSLVAEVRDDAHASRRSAVESPIYPVLFVKNGNTGGCLTLGDWLKPAALGPPTRATSLRSRFGSLLAYQLATVDWENSGNFIAKVLRLPQAMLDEATAELVRVSAELPTNAPIVRNLRLWQHLRAR